MRRCAAALACALVAATTISCSPAGAAVSDGYDGRSSLGPVPGNARYLSPIGSDSNPGTRTAPWRTLGRAQASARPGDTVVLMAGTYGTVGRETTMHKPGTASAPITYRGDPAGPMPTIRGAFKITRGYQRFNYMLFDGPTGPVKPRTSGNPDGEQVQVGILGKRLHGIEISDSEIRESGWHAGIFISGARQVRILGNYIHDNGDFSDPRQANTSHGIYFSRGSGQITGNLITHNVARGIQLYPNAQRTRIRDNVIDGSGSGIIFGGDSRSSSDHALVEGNVITNARTRRNLESYFEGGGGVGRGNLARFNCVYGTDDPDYAGAGGSGIQQPSKGFDLRGNVIADPVYSNRAQQNFTLAAGSPCRSLGEQIDADVAPQQQRTSATVATLVGEVPEPVVGPVRSLNLSVRRHGKWRVVRRRTLDSPNFSVPIVKRDARGDRRISARVATPGRAPSRPVSLRVPR